MLHCGAKMREMARAVANQAVATSFAAATRARMFESIRFAPKRRKTFDGPRDLRHVPVI